MIAISLGLSAALCWAIHDCMARGFAERIGPFRAAFWVALIGALLLLPIILYRGLLWQAEPQALGYALVLGLVYAVALASLFKAFSLAPVSIVGPMTAGYPALVVLWGLVNGLVPSPFEWLGLFVILLGAVVVGLSGETDGGRSEVKPGQMLYAILAIITANVAFAVAVVLGQAAAVSMGDFETTFVSRFPAALMLVPLFLKDRFAKPVLPAKAPTALIFMASLDVTAVTVINAAGHFSNKEFASMAISAYGALGVIIAMIFLKERVAKTQWLGIALVVLGVALLALPSTSLI